MQSVLLALDKRRVCVNDEIIRQCPVNKRMIGSFKIIGSAVVEKDRPRRGPVACNEYDSGEK